jgi:hypothetical protein
LEYQGETHYTSSVTFGSASSRQLVDKKKKENAKRSGITLISVPFWWNESTASLAATICQERPDIKLWLDVPARSQPISNEMPQRLLHQKFTYKPGEPVAYNDQIDPTGWYVYYFIYNIYNL